MSWGEEQKKEIETTQQSQKKDSQISEAISQAEEWKARADQEQTRAKDQERKLLEEQLNLKKTLTGVLYFNKKGGKTLLII